MKKEYNFAANDQIKLWHNADDPNEHFIELNIKFTRSLSHKERNQAVRHFVTGLKKLDVTDKYVVYQLDFSKPDFFQLTLQHVLTEQTRAWLQILVEFRQKFPVVSPKELIDFRSI